MDKAKAEFNWRVARGIALAVCLAGGWMAAVSPQELRLRQLHK